MSNNKKINDFEIVKKTSRSWAEVFYNGKSFAKFINMNDAEQYIEMLKKAFKK